MGCGQWRSRLTALLFLMLLAVGMAIVGQLREIAAGPDKKAPPVGKKRADGYVFDSAGNPLAGVVVHAWLVGKAGTVVRGVTDVKGAYSLTLAVAKSYDITYTKSGYLYAGVKRLAGTEDQHICKLLYRRGEKVTASAAQEHLQVLDRTLFLANMLHDKEAAVFLSELAGKESPRALFAEVPFEFRERIPEDVATSFRDAQTAIARRAIKYR